MERKRSSMGWFIPPVTTVPGAVPGQSRASGTPPRFPTWRQEPTDCSVFWCFPAHVSKDTSEERKRSSWELNSACWNDSFAGASGLSCDATTRPPSAALAQPFLTMLVVVWRLSAFRIPALCKPAPRVCLWLTPPMARRKPQQENRCASDKSRRRMWTLL